MSKIPKCNILCLTSISPICRCPCLGKCHGQGVCECSLIKEVSHEPIESCKAALEEVSEKA